MSGKAGTRPRKPRARKRRPLRPLDKQGEYKRCRIGLLGWRACPGEFPTKSGLMTRRHQRCGGDGWIRIGTKRAPRRRGGPPRPRRPKRPKGTGRTRRRVTGTLAVAAGLWSPAGQYLGTVGQVLVIALVATLVVLKVLAWTLGAVATLGAPRRAT